MGTKRRKMSPRKTSPGRTRPGGRVSRQRLEKIPIPPIPAFLQGASRAPAHTQAPSVDPPREAIALDAISDEEADLLLGVTSAVEYDWSIPDPSRPGADDSAGAIVSDLSADALSEDEPDQLPDPAAEPAVPPRDHSAAATRSSVPPETSARSGASGAAVLNALVDEIEKDLERDLDRHAPADQPPRYARTIGCWVTPLADASHLQPPEVAKQKTEEEGSR